MDQMKDCQWAEDPCAWLQPTSELKGKGMDELAVQSVTLKKGKPDVWHSKLTKRIFNVS